MAITFPSNPSLNQTFTSGDTTFVWNGTAWTVNQNANIVADTTPQLGGDLDLNNQDITGTGDINLSGIITATSGIDAIGIQSGGVNIATGIITALNFIGAGNTFALNGTVVDISIAGGGGGTGTATTITLADESSDTTCFPIFATDATGDQEPKTGSNLTFNSSTGALTAGSFVKSSNSGGFLKADGTEDTSTYLTSETQTLDDVLGLGNTSSTGLSVGVVTATSFDGNLTGFDELTAPHSSTTKNYSVTVSSKSDHRYQGTGSGSAYYIDGVESPILHLTPGRTYRFTLSSSDMSSHPFRFYLEADKTTSYTTNVTSTATYTEIVVTDETPAVIHYQCSAHGYMGNAVITHSNAVNTPYLITGLDGANITGVVTATSFSGDGSSLTGVAVGAATTITLADESTDTICYPIFSTDPTGDRELKTDASNLLYNSNTGALTAGSFFGDGSTLTDVLSNVSEDTTPQLGGPLDINSNNITGTGNIDITGSLDVSGIASVGSAITMYGSTGIVSATEYYGDGSNLSSIVTQLTAGTGIVLNQTTGNVTITASGGGDADPTTRTTTRFVATASQSSFTVSYNVGYVDVFLNGSKLDSTEYTATNGTSVSLTTAAAADDIVEIVAYESVGIVSITSATQGLDVTGHLETDTLNVSGISTFQGNVHLLDDDKLLLGGVAGTHDGLEIYHDGSSSYIKDVGTGSLLITTNGGQIRLRNGTEGEDMANFIRNGAVELFYDDSKKFETTNTGVTITGDISATGGTNAIGIQSGGVNIATGIITALNFIGTGNTFALNGTVVDISIAGGGGSSGIEIENSGSSVGTAITAINFSTNLTATASGGIATITASGGGGGGISSVAEDTTPQLGGDLDLNSNDITGTGNVNITGIITATSFVKSSNSGGFLKADGTEDTNTYLTSYAETQTLDDVLGLGNTSSTGLSVGVVTATSFDGNLTGFDYLSAPGAGSTVTFTVTVASKTAAHRFNGAGSSNGYLIDGVEAPFLSLTPARTYRFDQSDSSNSGHPLRFYLEADKTTQWTTLVTTNGTAGQAGAYTEIIVGETTPTHLNYQCSAHAYMGNIIHSSSPIINTPFSITGLDDADITGTVTAGSFVKDGGLVTQFLKANGSVDSSTYLTSYTETDPVVAAINGIVKSDGSTISAASAGTDYLAPTGDGSGLSGIVTNIQAGANITVLESPAGNFIVTSTAAGGGDTVTINATATDILSVSSGDISADDAGADKLVFWDDSESKLTYLTAGSGLSISGTTITASGGGGGSSGIEIENSGSSVGTAITAINFSTNLTATASGGIATITADGSPPGNPVSKSSNETTATAGQTVFNGTYTVGFVDVYLNGSKLSSSEFTATNGTSITLTTGATVNDIIEIVGHTFANGSTNVELSTDSTPELGGNLDIKGFNIVDSVGGGSITATVSGMPDALEMMLFT